jgi:hypothetical protein
VLDGSEKLELAVEDRAPGGALRPLPGDDLDDGGRSGARTRSGRNGEAQVPAAEETGRALSPARPEVEDRLGIPDSERFELRQAPQQRRRHLADRERLIVGDLRRQAIGRPGRRRALPFARELFELRGSGGEADRLGMAPEPHQAGLPGSQEVVQIDPGDAPPRADRRRTVDREEDRRTMELARQAAGGDADDAAVPVGAPADQDRGQLAPGVARGAVVDHLPLEGPAGLVRPVESSRELARPRRIAGEQKLERRIGGAEPSGSIEARAEAKADIVG